MNLWFTFGYVILGSAIVGLECIGVFNKKSGDTVTENWRWVDSFLKLHPALQWFWRVFTVGFLAWLALHFGGAWK